MLREQRKDYTKILFNLIMTSLFIKITILVGINFISNILHFTGIKKVQFYIYQQQKKYNMSIWYIIIHTLKYFILYIKFNINIKIWYEYLKEERHCSIFFLYFIVKNIILLSFLRLSYLCFMTSPSSNKIVLT